MNEIDEDDEDYYGDDYVCDCWDWEDDDDEE